MPDIIRGFFLHAYGDFPITCTWPGGVDVWIQQQTAAAAKIQQQQIQCMDLCLTNTNFKLSCCRHFILRSQSHEVELLS